MSFDNGWQYRDCCGGNPNCANNRTKNFIDEVFSLVHTDINKARDMLYSYMESVETDRDWNMMKRKELLKQIKELR